MIGFPPLMMIIILSQEVIETGAGFGSLAVGYGVYVSAILNTIFSPVTVGVCVTSSSSLLLVVSAVAPSAIQDQDTSRVLYSSVTVYVTLTF